MRPNISFSAGKGHTSCFHCCFTSHLLLESARSSNFHRLNSSTVNHLFVMKLSFSEIFPRWQYSKPKDPSEESYEEGRLLKHSFDGSSSQSQFIENFGTRTNINAVPRYFVWLNIMFFCLSLWLFTTSVISRELDVEHRERNYFLKQTSEPCTCPSFCKTCHVS